LRARLTSLLANWIAGGFIARAISTRETNLRRREASPSTTAPFGFCELFEAQIQPWTKRRARSFFHFFNPTGGSRSQTIRCSWASIDCRSMATPKPWRGWIRIPRWLAEAMTLEDRGQVGQKTRTDPLQRPHACERSYWELLVLSQGLTTRSSSAGFSDIPEQLSASEKRASTCQFRATHAQREQLACNLRGAHHRKRAGQPRDIRSDEARSNPKINLARELADRGPYSTGREQGDNQPDRGLQGGVQPSHMTKADRPETGAPFDDRLQAQRISSTPWRLSIYSLFRREPIPVGDPSQRPPSKHRASLGRQRPPHSRGGDRKLNQPATALHPHGLVSRLSEVWPERMLRVAVSSATRGGAPPPAAPAVGLARLAEGCAGQRFCEQGRWPIPFANTAHRAEAATHASASPGCSRSPDPHRVLPSPPGQQGQAVAMVGPLRYSELEPDLAPPGSRRGPGALITRSQGWKRFCRSQHPGCPARELWLSQCNCCREIDHHRPTTA